MKRILCILLVLTLFLSGCAGGPSNTTPSTNATGKDDPVYTACLQTESTGPLLAKDYLGSSFINYFDEIAYYEVLIPENGVLILNEQKSFENIFIDGDVYITATANITFHNVHVRGKVYCHGTLYQSGYSEYQVFSYCEKSARTTTCSAYDGSHGQIICKNMYGGISTIGEDVLDYAFEKWGNFGPVSEKPDLIVSQNPIEPETVQHGDTSKLYPEAFIFNGEGYVSDKEFFGDVYITSNSVIEFDDVRVFGDIYCYGQLKFSNNDTIYTEDFTKNNQALAIYAYSFQESCESFDGVHGLIVGGPITCTKIVISDDALDYAFTTFGKQ